MQNGSNASIYIKLFLWDFLSLDQSVIWCLKQSLRHSDFRFAFPLNPRNTTWNSKRHVFKGRIQKLVLSLLRLFGTPSASCRKEVDLCGLFFVSTLTWVCFNRPLFLIVFCRNWFKCQLVSNRFPLWFADLNTWCTVPVPFNQLATAEWRILKKIFLRPYHPNWTVFLWV